MPEYATLRFEVRDHVAHLTLNRPEAANSLSPTVSAEMMDAVLRCEEEEEIRALVISGTGRMFCAGADLKGFYTPSDGLKSRVSYFHATLSRLARADLPVIAAVNGAAAGAGMGLACACDLVIAAESARFVMAYARIGLSPDGGTTYFLPRRIGIGRALELFYTNRTLSAREALEWGIANRVVPDSELATESHTLATQLAAGPTRAFGAVRGSCTRAGVRLWRVKLNRSCAVSQSWRGRRTRARPSPLLPPNVPRSLRGDKCSSPQAKEDQSWIFTIASQMKRFG